MNALRARPELQLLQTLQIRSQYATDALLFGIAAEIAEQSPTVRRLQSIYDALGDISEIPSYRAQLGSLLRREAGKAIADERYHHAIWREYQNLLNPLSRSNIKPWGSKHCDPTQVYYGQCSLDPEKPCPFGDWYCANRVGASCDHISAALQIASRLWSDLADVSNEADERIKKSRCRSLTRAHLSVWVPRIAEALMNRTRTDFYQIEALLIGTLSSTPV